MSTQTNKQTEKKRGEKKEREEEGKERRGEERRENVWDICVSELQGEQGEEIHIAGFVQWFEAFGVPRIRFRGNRD